MDPEELRQRKVQMIFDKFDKNGDGRLNREEMAKLVIAVNPKVKFKDEQIQAILDEVFRTYGGYIEADMGLSLEGLQRTYDDGAGDVDRDFEALRLVMDIPQHEDPDVYHEDEAPAEEYEEEQHEVPFQEEDKGGYDYLSTKHLMDRLKAVLDAKRDPQDPSFVKPSYELTRTLLDLRGDANSLRPNEAIVEASMAMGRLLMQSQLLEDALPCFQRAVELDPGNVRAHFLCGNCLFSLNRVEAAREAYEGSLQAGKADPEAHRTLLPQVHINLGIALEAEGLLMCACEHYREAAQLNPEHYRALKLLGSARYGLGEYHAAEEALQSALFSNPNFDDAYCDLGSTLQALKEDQKAGQAFEKALSINPNHINALYNYAGLLRATEQFEAAVQTYQRVLELDPQHWQARLNMATSLLGQGRAEAAKVELEKVYKMTNRVEVFDMVAQLRKTFKKNKKMTAALESLPDAEGEESIGPVPAGSVVVVDPSKVSFADDTVSRPDELAATAELRLFQKMGHLSKIQLDSLVEEISEETLDVAPRERMIRKSAVELTLRRLLPELAPEPFQAAVREINMKVISAVEQDGMVDFGLFIAIIALLCSGPTPDRKSVAFHALMWRRGSVVEGGRIVRRDAEGYVLLVHELFLPGQPSPPPPGGEQTKEAEVDFTEFDEMVAHYIPTLFTLLKLENHDRTRHVGMSCSACRYPIVGLRYREVKGKFDLCSNCYIGYKVPAKHRRREYTFAEYVGGTDKVREKLGFYGRSLSRTPVNRSFARSFSRTPSQAARASDASE